MLMKAVTPALFAAITIFALFHCVSIYFAAEYFFNSLELARIIMVICMTKHLNQYLDQNRTEHTIQQLISKYCLVYCCYNLCKDFFSTDVTINVLKSVLKNTFQFPVTISGVGRRCWNVTYTDRRVCALEGSSVEITGSYSHPSDRSVSKVFWFYPEPGKQFLDLRYETQFTNRAEYINKDRNSTLKINHLTKKDSGEYILRFTTTNNDGFAGRPGVILRVTGNVLH